MWTEGKTARSRRTFGIDADTANHLASHRALQRRERLAGGAEWRDFDLIVATTHGNIASPGNFDQTLERLVARSGLPRLTSHGLRHTAATHMVRQAADVGELRAAADVLGHSPDMLLKTYAHVRPDSMAAVAERIGRRRPPSGRAEAPTTASAAVESFDAHLVPRQATFAGQSKRFSW